MIHSKITNIPEIKIHVKIAYKEGIMSTTKIKTNKNKSLSYSNFTLNISKLSL